MTIRSYQYAAQVLVAAESSVSKTVTDALGLSSDASANSAFGTAENVLSLVNDVVVVFMPGGASIVSQTLGLTDEAIANLSPNVESVLDLQQTIDLTAPIKYQPSQDLALTQEVIYGFKVRTKSVEDTLSVVDSARIALPQSVSQSLNLTDQALWISLEDEISFTELAEWGYGIDVEDDIDLTQAVDVDQVLNKTITHSDVVSQAAAWYVEDRCARMQFKTFHGEGGVAPLPKKLNYKSNFVMISQLDGETLTLRNPETDNRRRYSFNRTNRRFFDNTLDLYADDSWATEQRQFYTIVATKKVDFDSVLAFLENNLGLEIWIKDWQGVTWNVVVVNPGEVFTEDGEGYWTLEFEVTGDPLDGEFAIDSLQITHANSRAGSIWVRSGVSTIAITDQANRHYNEDVTGDVTGLLSDASFTIV